MNVLELDEVISKMTLQLKLTVEWIDSRLEYVDLKRPVLLFCHKISDKISVIILSLIYYLSFSRGETVFLKSSYRSKKNSGTRNHPSKNKNK